MKRFLAVAAFLFSILLVAPAQAQSWRGVQLDPGSLIRPELLTSALASYDRHRSADLAAETIAIVDFAKPSSDRRLYLLDLRSGAVKSLLVAHGQGSDRDHDGVADSFSDSNGSHASSLGAFRAAARYQGGHGLSLALDGLDATNRSARARAVVVHSAGYVSDAVARQRGKLGRSWGCFVVDPNAISEVVRDLEGGGFIYAGR